MKVASKAAFTLSFLNVKLKFPLQVTAR